MWEIYTFFVSGDTADVTNSHFPIDDVYISGILREKSGLEIIRPDRNNHLVTVINEKNLNSTSTIAENILWDRQVYRKKLQKHSILIAHYNQTHLYREINDKKPKSAEIIKNAWNCLNILYLYVSLRTRFHCRVYTIAGVEYTQLSKTGLNTDIKRKSREWNCIKIKKCLDDNWEGMAYKQTFE